MIILVAIDQTVSIQDLPISDILQRHDWDALFLLVPNLFHDIRHSIEEAAVHLQSKVVVFVKTTPVLRLNEKDVKVIVQNKVGAV